MEALAADGRAVLAEEGYAADEIDFNYRYELRYAGQSSELAVEVPASAAPLVLQQLPAAFGSEYRRTFGYVADDALELVNVRLMARGLRAGRVDFDRLPQDARAVAGLRGVPKVSLPPAAGHMLERPAARDAVWG